MRITDVSNISLITQLNHGVEEEKSSEVVENPIAKSTNRLNKKLLFSSSAAIGIGAGLAMMPIYNHEVKELKTYSIDVGDYEIAFVISTLNTLLLTSTCSIINLYKNFSNTEVAQEFTNNQKIALTVAKLGAIISSLVPLGLLWNVELHDQQVDNSEGFDKFVAWAAFTSIPLMALKTVENYDAIKKLVKGDYDNLKLDSTGAKLITYSTTILSAIARGISFSVIASEVAKNMGVEEDTADIMGVVIGGILSNSTGIITEHFSLKNTFHKKEHSISVKEFALGAFSVVEGLWFSLPTITVGLNYTANWNPLVKGFLFAPFLLSKTTQEATNIYNSFYQNEEVSQGASNSFYQTQDELHEVSIAGNVIDIEI